MSLTSSFAVLLLGSVATAGCATTAAFESKPTPVEVWRGGEDGLTVRFADALEAQFRAASDFTPSTGKVPGTLIVTIPTHLPSKQIAGQTQVSYTVQFTGVSSEALGSSVGNCSEEQLAECASHVLLEARVAKAKLGREPINK